MTIENVLKLMEAWKNNIEKGINVKRSKENIKKMEEHILKSEKFKDHKIRKEIENQKERKQNN